MTHVPERPTVLRLSVAEYEQVRELAKERGMQPEHWLCDVVKLALVERRDGYGALRQREREVLALKTEVVKLTQTIMSMKTGVTQ